MLDMAHLVGQDAGKLTHVHHSQRPSVTAMAEWSFFPTLKAFMTLLGIYQISGTAARRALADRYSMMR